MAIFRKVHTLIWSDPFFSELDAKKKLFFIYLLTNERTKQCGIYEISKRQISFDLGYTIDSVSILLEYFMKKGKIQYSDKTNEVALKNWDKYNSSTSPKVKKCIESELIDIKDRALIEYLYSIDTASQEEQEEEQEEEEEQDKPLAFSFMKSLINLGAEKNLVTDWLKVRKTKKLTNTETAFNSLKNEIDKSGKDINQILKTCCENSWGGFKSSWNSKDQTNSHPKPTFHTNR